MYTAHYIYYWEVKKENFIQQGQGWLSVNHTKNILITYQIQSVLLLYCVWIWSPTKVWDCAHRHLELLLLKVLKWRPANNYFRLTSWRRFFWQNLYGYTSPTKTKCLGIWSVVLLSFLKTALVFTKDTAYVTDVLTP